MQQNIQKPNADADFKPRSLALAASGVETCSDLAKMMLAVMVDVIEERLTPALANASCNAAGKALKAVELRHKYGASQDGIKDLSMIN